MTSKTKAYDKYMSFKSIFYFCSLPVRLDSYLGCTHGCLYCFSQRLNNRAKGFHRKSIPADPDRFDRYMTTLHSKHHKNGLVRSCLKHKVPLHFGCVSDPFPQIERERKVTFRFLEVLSKLNYPFVICTKSTLVAQEPYLSLLAHTPCSVQISFSSFDDNLARKLEPNAPSSSARLRAIKKLSGKGIFTVARLQPFLYPLETIQPHTIRIVANAGVKHLVLEHLRIPTNSSKIARNRLWKATGIDFVQTYRQLGIKHSRVSYELSSDIKLENILFCRGEVHKQGMSFGSGDNDFHHVSDTPCCCGLPDQPEFQNIYKGHLGIGACQAMKTG